MFTGTVKWFNEAKGFGFIVREDNQDVFVHYSAIDGGGFRTLLPGDRVAYDEQKGPKGLFAAHVHRLDAMPRGDAT
jgi:CspA family cold shock protein